MNLGLDKYFLITNNSIKNIWGSEFYFTGLQINPQSLKSKEGYLFCWIEEAENIEERAFNILNPTIRLSGCNIFISFNPVDINGFIYKNFVTNNNRTNCRIQQINYTDNIWASKEFIDDAEYMLKNDIQQYNHHYLGAPLRISDAVIFKDRWEVSTIEYEVRSLHEELYLYTNHELVNGGNNQLLYGLDYGFTDALAIIECFAHNAILYVTNELYRSQLPILDIAKEAITLMPYIDRYKVACDDSAPSIINALCAEGNYRLNATRAYKGEIMHGIIIMKQFRKIIIDKKCKNLIREIANYKYSQDKITGEIDKKPIDKNNHAIDALRYAVTYMMNNREEQ
jgi:phage terminase large subunit